MPGFCFGFVLKQSKTTLQQSWLSNCPGCQRSNDPGSRAKQAPRQQEHRAAGKESKVWDHRSTAPRAAANSHRDTDQLGDLGSPLQSCSSHSSLVHPCPTVVGSAPASGPKMGWSCQARDFFLKCFLFKQRPHNRVKMQIMLSGT